MTALAAAAELILVLESAAKSTGSIDTVATVGVCEVFPGAVNSVPSSVRLETDIRDTDSSRRDSVISQLRSSAALVAEKRGVEITFEVVNADPPASCGQMVIEAIEQSVAETGYSSQRMVSRAYHDSLFMARLAPVAMIFIPSWGGVSHRPDEYSSPQSIAIGAELLAGS